jgi:hypothetical protein
MSTLEVLRMIVTALENTLEAWDYNGGGDAWCREVHGEYIESARAVVEVGKKTIKRLENEASLPQRQQ